VFFVTEFPGFTAVNVPFNRAYPTSPSGLEAIFYTIVVFHQAPAYPYTGLVGLFAHELAYCFVSERGHGSIAMLIFAVHIGHTQITPEYFPVLLKSTRSAFILFGILCSGGVFASLVRGKVHLEH